jgi:type III restriction enzyme
MTSGLTYRIDPGRTAQVSAFDEGFKNADLALSEAQILENIQKVQRRQKLPVSSSLSDFTTLNNKGARVPAPAAYRKQAFAATPIHLDVEMETGTGKTYCYVKTLFELNQRYGWSKFISMVPSIVIREGVYKSPPSTSPRATARRRASSSTTPSACTSWRASPRTPASTSWSSTSRRSARAGPTTAAST